MARFCSQCGAQNRDDARFCTRCATPFTGALGHQPSAPPGSQSTAEPPPYQPGMNVQAAYQQPTYQPAYPPPQGWAPAATAKSKLAAGLLGIFLGSLGIHRFYLGYNAIGVIQLILGLPLGFLTCGITTIVAQVWGLIEGILILTGSIATDAQGMPLKE